MAPNDLSKFEQLKATGDLPSPKGVALAIIQMTIEDSVPLSELARVIKADPAFVGRVVRAANGINAMGRRPVVSVQDALVVLGVPAVRSLALGFSLMSSYSAGMCRNFDYSAFWSHSLACAVAMQGITALTRAARPEETFSVGLLARIGELALATLYSAAYSGVLEHTRKFPDIDLAALEQAAFAMNHRELAAAMLTDWGIPKVYVDPVFHHEDIERSELGRDSRQAVLTLSLVLSRCVADICLAEPARRGVMVPRLYELAAELSIGADEMTDLSDRVVREWQDWGRLLEADTRELPSFNELRQFEPSPERGADEDPESKARRIRVLVVDDDAAQRAVLRGTLEELDSDIYEAPDGRSGLEMALEVQPHMMIIDWVMPGMDGVELVQALRATRAGRGMFIMILTAYDDDDHLVRAFNSGVDDFVTKPLRPRVLAARLRAGQRVIGLQRAIARDREEIHYFAAELAVTNRRLQELAMTDSLTGFPNRHYAMDRIQQEWAACSRSRRPLAVMAVDVDNFKKINDSYGHDVGDTVLKDTAAVIKKALRSQDIVCRIGGDEFLIICPDTNLDQALVCAERVRRAVEATPIRADHQQLSTSLSIGVAVRETNMRDPNALMKGADRGVYLAKQRGRNRIATVQQRS